MKTCILGTLDKAITKDSYGGTEILTYYLVDYLIKKGHDVTLLATSESKNSAKLIAYASSKETIKDLSKSYSLYFSKAKDIILKNDIIISSIYDIKNALPLLDKANIPSIAIVHSPIFESQDLKNIIFLKQFTKQHFVFVSKNASSKADKIFINKHVIYNGIDITQFPFNQSTSDYMFWMSRFFPNKGAQNAVEAALRLNLPLKLAGPINVEDEKKLFREEIKPRMKKNQLIQYIGQLNHKQKISVYQKAKVFLFPIEWEEPFGLVMIEAMACGTPVIAYRRGAIPEIIKDGITGLIVEPNNIDDLVKAINKIYRLPQKEYDNMRLNCRKHIENNFTIDRMIDQYEELIQKLVKQK